MSQRAVLSAYTPSNTDPALLKRIFVQRQRLLEKLTERLARSATTGDMHHALLIGPRGCGKTNLVTLIEHGLTQRPDLADSMRIAWLGEDDTFADPIHLALAIADQLAKKYSDEFDNKPRDAVRGLSPTDAANAVLGNVVTQLGTRTLLVITENFDRTLASFGDAGQKQWRAFLQETSRFATLATAQQLTDDISSRDKPFFGFFDPLHLKPLEVDDARDLIRNIGLEQEKTELAAYLTTAEGRYRVRALHHLAGGNHRMYVLLAEFLTRDALDDLVQAFEGLAEELTPYFQERLRSLSPQQATLVECLCSHARAMTVKEIAETTFVEERTCSKQLGNLRRKGYVVSQKRGKESYYDMAEPLMRLCLEVKNQRGRPLRTLARFLRAWFPDQELLTARGHSARTDAYLKAAIAADPSYDASIASDLQNQIRQCLDQELYSEAAVLRDELEYIKPSALNDSDAAGEMNEATADHALLLLKRGVAHGQAGDIKKAIADFTQVIELPNVTSQLLALAFGSRGVAYSQSNDTGRSIGDFTSVIELPDLSSDLVAMALISRGIRYGQTGDTASAIADFSEVIAQPNVHPDQLAKALDARAIAYNEDGDTASAIADLSTVVELPNRSSEQVADALIGRGTMYGEARDTARAIADFSRLVELPGTTSEQLAKGLLGRGAAHSEANDTEQAVADFTRVVELPSAATTEVAEALNRRGIIYGLANDTEEALVDFTRVLELPGVPSDQVAWALNNRGVAYVQAGEAQRAIADLTRAIGLPDVGPTEVAHALNCRGTAYSHAGDSDEAHADFTRVLEMPGVPTEQLVRALVGRGAEYWGTQRYVLSQRALAECIAIVGASPSTTTSALFALPEPMVATSDIGEVMSALTTAFKQGSPDSAEYGGSPKDLLVMVLSQQPNMWQRYATELAPLYIAHDQAPKLAYGLTQSIAVLDKEQFSEPNLNLWQTAWQQAGRDHEELELALKILDAAVEVIKTKSDRPLFRLPPEIRELIRPLLKQSLGEET